MSNNHPSSGRRSSSPTRGIIDSLPTTPINSPPRKFTTPDSARSRRSYGSSSFGGGSASRPNSMGRNSGNNGQFSDRFIPSRLGTNLEDAFDMMENRDASKDQNLRNDVAHENQLMMSNLLRSELLGQSVLEYSLDSRMDGHAKPLSRRESNSSNLFKFRSSTGSGSYDSNHSSSSGNNFHNAATPFGGGQSPARRSVLSPKKTVRKISMTPFKVLDAPALQDDYYLNLVDWSHHNILSVALGSSVYLWSACTSKVTRLCDFGSEDSVTSIAWATSGNQISVGTNSGKIQVWDASTCEMVREMHGHESRVGTMAWNSTLLASGSRDRNIYLQDIRIRSNNGTSNNSRFNRSGTTRESSVSAESSAIVEQIADRSLSGEDRAAEEMTDTDGPDTTSEEISGDPSLDFLSGSDFISSRPTSRRATYSGIDHTTAVDDGPTNDSTMNRHSTAHNIQTSVYRRSTGGHLFSTSPGDSLGMNVARAASADASTTANGSTSSSSVVRELSAHKQEVCGLKWSFDEKMLASGGNDNKLFVWESQQGRSTDPLCRFEEHTAAVKAVAWSPHQHGLLASGGGTADRHIRFWNASTSVPLHKIDTGSQVCNLMWSKNVNEIVSTHGYSLNQVIVWKYPSMQKIATLTGHSLRVLYLAMSPDGQNIVTGAGDETLRFWNVFPGPRNKTGYRIGPSLLTPSGNDIR